MAEDPERVEDGDEVLDGEASVLAALEPTDVALLRTERDRDLLLCEAVGTPQDAKLLSQRGDRLTSRLVSTLDVGDRVALNGSVDAQEAALLEQSQRVRISPLLGCRSRIVAIPSDRHCHSRVTADACADDLGRTP